MPISILARVECRSEGIAEERPVAVGREQLGKLPLAQCRAPIATAPIVISTE
jgi:hypothetical protein